MDSPVFILSTGRTGTQFFEDYINQTTTDAVCRHEPAPSRRFKFLSNLYLAQKVNPAFIKKIYRRSRSRLFRKVGDKRYIESSNFLFGCIPPLNGLYSDIKVIHIVRHPVGYTKSHLGHGFWKGHKKFFARHVPYWMEQMEVADSSNPIQLLSARWNLVNRQISSYAQTNSYLLVRFEELFSRDLQKSSMKLNQIRKFCGLEALNEEENIAWLQRPKNYSRRKQVLKPDEVETILKKCAHYMQEFQYHE